MTDAEALEEKLRVADYSLSPQQQLPDLPKDWSVTDSFAQLAEEVVADPPEEAQTVAPVPDPELACAFEQAVQADRAPAVPVLGYVVSVTRGGRHRKLHHVGICRFVPGVDY